MQKQKNIHLLLILGGLIALLTLIPFLKKKNGLSVNKRLFSLNQQTVITDVILNSTEIKNKLNYTNGSWKINNTYKIDPNMRDIFFSVLSQMEIRKTWSKLQKDSLAKLVKAKGIEVSILNNGELIKHYFIWGNAASKTSLLMDEYENGYWVHIPGYRSYVAGIFQVPTSDWRDRRIFTAQFLNLNNLKLEYTTENIEFRQKNNFFEIINIAADSAKLITSLENLLFLQTDRYLVPKEYANYKVDSLIMQMPFVIISTKSFTGLTEKIKIYSTKNSQPFYLGFTTDSSYCLFNKKRLNKILVKKSDFK